MKTDKRSLSVLRGLVCLVLLMAAGMVQAADLYSSGTKTWDTTTANWGTGSGGPYNTATWANAAPDSAIFEGTAGTVTLGEGITVGGLTFNTTAYAIANSTYTLTFGAGNDTITMNNVAAATVTGQLGGSGNVTLTAANPATAGTLTLNGTSTGGWSGTTTINPGMTMSLSVANQGLLNTSGITLNGGGITLVNTTGTEGAYDRVANGAGITVNSGTISYNNSSVANGLYAETIGSVDLVSGQLNIVENTSMANGAQNQNNQTITLSDLTRAGAGNSSAITFSALTTGPQASGNRNMIVVTGAGSTGANQIIGPWATVGTAANAQTDYAVYSSDYVIPAGIGGSAETAWTTAANAYTMSANQTLTGTRTITALRNATGSGGTLTLATGANLETYGLLSGAQILAVNPGTGGALTTPTGGGNLFITAGGNNITIAAPINDNGGAVTLVKSGGSTLTLSSTTSTFSGGIVLNAGALTTSADSNLGNASGGVTVNGAASWTYGNADYARNITINDGAVLSMTGTSQKNFSGVLSGNGALNQTGSIQINFTNPNNSFTGPMTIAYLLQFASLGDSSNPINFGGANRFNWTGGSQTFALRPFTMHAAGTAPISNNGSGPLTIQQPLSITGAAGARTLSLGGTYTATANQFSGNITDGPGSVVSLTKGADDSTWAVSGINTYTGATSIGSGGVSGFLIFQGMQSLSPSTPSLNQAQTGSNQRWNTIKLLDDSTTPASRSGVNLSWSIQENIDPNGAGESPQRYFMRVFVGNNSIANGGTSASMQTGSTIQLGNLTLTEGSTTATGQGLWVTGANGYKLQIANVTVTLQAATAVNHQATLRADAPLTVTGTVQQGNDAAVGSNTRLQLEGVAIGSLISGNIQNSAGGRLLSVTKAGLGDWTLSGNNAYSGVTTVSGGVLVLNHATALPGGIGASGGTSALTFNGGVLGLGVGDFTRDLGTAGTVTAVNFTGAGGWAAYDADRLVNLNNDSHQIVWATANTGFNGQLLILGASAATYKVTLQNGLDLGAAVRTVQVADGSATVDAELSGVITGVAGGNLTKTGSGTLQLSGANTYVGVTTVSAGGGTLAISSIDNVANANPLGQSSVAAANLLLGNTTTLKYVGSAASTDRGFTINGTAAGNQATLDASGSGAVNFTSTASPAYGTVDQSRVLILTGSNTDNNTLAANIANNGTGAVQIQKNGVGIWVLSGANTYTGPTTINAGTLAIGVAGSIGGGFYAANIANTGTFRYNSTAAQTISGIISGSGGALTKDNTGTLTLTANNTYDGATTISGGALVGVAGGSCANSAVTVNDTAGCTLGVAVGDSTKQWTCASLTIGGANATLAFGFSTAPNTTLAPLNVTGNLIFTGVPAITVDPGNLVSGQSYALLTCGGTAPSGEPAVTIGAGLTGTTSWTGNTLYLNVAGASTLPLKWALDGNGDWDINTTANWKDNTAASVNYTEGPVVGDPVVFDGTYITAARTVALNTTVKPASVTVNNPSGENYTISGSGRISGTTGLTKFGAGILTLSTANTFTGDITINGGTLTLGANNACGNITVNGSTLTSGGTDVGSATLGVSGGTITFTGTSFYNPQRSSSQAVLTYNKNVTVSSGTTTFQMSTQYYKENFSGVLSGNGTIVKNDSNATLNFSHAANTFTGAIRLDGGSGGFIVNSLADSANTITFNGNTGAFSLGAGTASSLLFSSRQIVLAANGSIANNNGTAANTITINTALGYSGAGTRTLTLGGSNTGDNTFAGIIVNNGASAVSVTKAGGGLWILSGNNTFTGPVTISGGILSISSVDVVANANPLGRSSVAAANLLLGNGTTLRYTGAAASCDRAFTINGTANTHSATIDASGTGALSLTSTTSPAYGTVNQTRTLILSGSNTDNNTLAANIGNNGTGAVSLTKIGEGTWTLSGASTYSGGTTIGNTTTNAGTVNITHGSALGSGLVALLSNTAGKLATLTFNSATGITVANNFSTSGTGQGNNGIIRNVTGTNTISGTISLVGGGGDTRIQSDGGSLLLSGAITNGWTGGSRTLILAGSATGTVSGVIANGSQPTLVTKTGSGTWTLTGVNTYSGATTVNAGTLLVNGSIVAGSAINFVGGTLGGSGTIGGSVSVPAAGNLSPGSGGAGTLTIGGDLDISALAGGAGKLKFELGALAGSDRIVVTGALTIGDGLLGFSDFEFTAIDGAEVGTYTLITSVGIVGTLDGADLSGNVGIQSGALQINGNNIELVVKASGSVFMFK